MAAFSLPLHPAFDPDVWQIAQAEEILVAASDVTIDQRLDALCDLLIDLRREQQRQADLIDRLLQIIAG